MSDDPIGTMVSVDKTAEVRRARDVFKAYHAKGTIALPWRGGRGACMVNPGQWFVDFGDRFEVFSQETFEREFFTPIKILEVPVGPTPLEGVLADYRRHASLEELMDLRVRASNSVEEVNDPELSTATMVNRWITETVQRASTERDAAAKEHVDFANALADVVKGLCTIRTVAGSGDGFGRVQILRGGDIITSFEVGDLPISSEEP